MIKKELRIFWTAVMFYTRIPCPKSTDHDPAYINKSTRYFPLIGYIVGTTAFIVFSVSNYFLNPIIAITLSTIATILLTGALHEDGFADVCDGFGGGWTKEKILTIMKDSSIGAYGAIGIFLILLLKVFLIEELITNINNSHTNIYLHYFLFFITAHSISRFVAITIVFTHQYTRDDATSKIKPVAKEHTKKEIIGATFFGLLPLAILSYLHWQIVIALPILFLMRQYLTRYFQKWIQGYTGDCLGATQQVCETLFYLSSIIIWKYI